MKIDVIIPCYDSYLTLPRTLGSIVSQVIVDDIDVTIVNDGDSDNDYSAIIKHFEKFVNIKELKLKKNFGPGYARRYGYEHTSNPLVTWIDADDTFSGAFALKLLRQELLEQPQNVICIGAFVEEHAEAQPKPQYIAHNQDTIWMFGKMYKREFLDQHEIRMNDTRANEDNGFNMLCKLCCNEQQIKFIPDVVYYWHTNENSITRINDCQYSYDQSFVGYTDNMIWAFKEAEKRNPFNGAILYEKVATLMNLYEYYIETEVRDDRFIEQNWNCCLKYYKEIYREIKDKIPKKAFIEAYNNVIRNCYMGDKLNGIIPSIGIYEFINKLEEECKSTQDLKTVG